ncbi:MAG TPA: NUDIX domain-containing protein [Verrucomicrobiae bacterium]|nr:NUDIX domain-containing protein [Verrucomicrobiae bacterium]
MEFSATLPYAGRVIRNVIFDWSGTLVDDLPAVWQACNHVLRNAGVPEMPLDQFRAEFSLPVDAFYRRYLGHVPPQQFEQWFFGYLGQVQDSVVELPHARDFLIFCRERGLKTFVLSAVQEDHFTRQSRQNGFAEFLDTPYSGVRDKRDKIHEVLRDHDLRPEETLFVGDMQHDIETAKHGGIRSCAVLTGYNRLEQLRASEPDVIVEHLGELRELLRRNNLEWVANSAAPGREAVNGLPIATVGALIFDDQDRVLMIRTHKWSDLWGIPGGKIKLGEASLDALRREILEETDLTITDIRFVLVQDCIHSQEFYRDAHFVLLNYTCRRVGQNEVKLNAEAQEYRWLTIAQALELPLNQPTRILIEAVQAAG